MAVVSLVVGQQVYDRALLLLTLVTVWAVRLSLYITWRNWGRGEDYRYQAMRRGFGPHFTLTSLFVVFGLQGLLTWLISLPVQVVMTVVAPPLGWLDAVGIGLWSVGFVFESLGDWQLARFKANPANAGRPLDLGLWRYTRHPNYFGDALVWWGFYVVAVSSPGGVWTIVSPIVMTYLLLEVSGVSLLETHLRRSKPGYEDYVRATSAFVPWFPKHHTHLSEKQVKGK